MKKISLLLFFLIPIFGLGQQKYDYYKGQKFIEKAQKNVLNEKFDKALNYLSKAEESTYGFCGSGNYSTLKNIERLKINSFIGLKKYDSIITLLDKKDFFFELEAKKDDSLKVEVLFLKHGKAKTTNSFKKASIISKKASPYNDFFIYTFFSENLNQAFTFKKANNENNKIEFENQNNFKSISKNTLFYNLIFED